MRPFRHLRRSWSVALIALTLVSASCGRSTPAGPAPQQGSPPPAAPAAPAAPAGQPAGSAQPAPQGGAGAAKPGERLKIRLGASFTPNSGPPIWVADKKGFFQAENLDVEPIKIPNFLQQGPALVAGQLDMVIGVLPSATVSLMCQGADVIVVAGGTRGAKGLPYELVGHVIRKDLWESGQVRGPKDFAGRRFGYFGTVDAPQGRSVAYYIDAVYGEVWGKMNRVSIPNDADIIAAMSQKQLDVAMLRAPSAWKIVSDGIAVEWVKQYDVMAPQYDMVMTTRKFAQKNPDAVVRFLRAYLKAQRYLTEVQKGQHKDEFVDIVKRSSDVPEPVILPHANAVLYTHEIDTKYNRENHEYLRKLGVIKCLPDDFMYDLSYLKKAQAQ